MNQKKMATNKDTNDDIVIELPNSQGDFSYNVSRFLRQCKMLESTKGWLTKVNEVIPLIDAKVHCDPSDPKYSHIYQSIDTIVHRLVAILSKQDKYFTHAKLRQTGSISSNTKVGLPHEADYVLEIPDDKTLKNDRELDGDYFF